MRLSLILLLSAATVLRADPAAPAPTPAAVATPAPVPAAVAKLGAKVALPPPVPIPPRFLQTRSKISELYPDADRLPAIWDNDHDPFRYGYVIEDDPDAAAAGGLAGGPGGTKDGKPVKRDQDTEALLEAGLDVNKGTQAPAPAPAPSGVTGGLAKLFGMQAPGGAASSTPAREFIPLNDAELLKRAVGKLKIGGVFVIRGASKIMIDGANHKTGDTVSVSVGGRRVNVKIEDLNPTKVVFVMVGAGESNPKVTVKF